MSFHTVLSVPLTKSIQHAWPYLWRKAIHTKQFIPNLQHLEVQQISPEVVQRVMKLGQFTVKQCIVKDSNSHTVYFHNLEGSAFQGLIYNRLREDKGKVILEFGSDAKGKDGILVPPVQMFMKTLNSTKNIIEEGK